MHKPAVSLHHEDRWVEEQSPSKVHGVCHAVSSELARDDASTVMSS
jgi:hypothetical protein